MSELFNVYLSKTNNRKARQKNAAVEQTSATSSDDDDDDDDARSPHWPSTSKAGIHVAYNNTAAPATSWRPIRRAYARLIRALLGNFDLSAEKKTFI